MQYTSVLQISDLPDDALVAILTRVPIRDRIVAERVSRRWLRLVEESWGYMRDLDFWDVISKTWDRHGEPTAEPQLFLQSCLWRVGPFLERLTFASCAGFRMSRYSLELIGQYCPNLRELDLSGRAISDKALEGLRILPPSVKTLSVSRCFESGSYEAKKAIDRALTSVLSTMANLQALNAEYNKSENSWGKGGMWVSKLQLRSLAVGSCALNADAFTSFISQNVGHIKEFRASEATFASGNWSNIDRCRKLLKKALSHWKSTLEILELRDFSGTFTVDLGQAVRLVPTLSHLTHLSLKSNRFVDDQLVAAICEGCQRLTTLNLACCYGVKRKGLDKLRTLPELSNLDLRRSASVDNDLIAMLCLRGKLASVCLRECTRITKVVLDDLILNCPNLHFVDLTGCKRIPPVNCNIRRDYAVCDHITILATELADSADDDENRVAVDQPDPVPAPALPPALPPPPPTNQVPLVEAALELLL